LHLYFILFVLDQITKIYKATMLMYPKNEVTILGHNENTFFVKNKVNYHT